ncbi:uncharacterized protein V6R79_024725 [Siganus canaliculatus]
MASYQHLLQHTKTRYESPAKVFAKLKSKVQREGLCANERLSIEPLCNVRDKHGAEFRSPRKTTDRTWMAAEVKENSRCSAYRNEATPLTLSPISSPLKTFGYSHSDINSTRVEKMASMTEAGLGCTPRKRTFQPLLLMNKEYTDPALTRDFGAFKGVSRTPVKIQSVQSDSGHEEDCALLMTSPCMYSPMRKRLRKRKLEPLGFSNVTSSTNEVNSEGLGVRKTSRALSEDDAHDNGTCMEALGHVGGFCAEPTPPPPRDSAKKLGCHVFLHKIPPMSPAKMFAYMKERENKKESQEVHVSSSIRGPLDWGNFHQSRDIPSPAAYSTVEMEDSVFTSVTDNVTPDGRTTVLTHSADSQSDTDRSGEGLTPGPPPQPILLEDPLVLNSPNVSIPKRNPAVFKCKNWPRSTTLPCEDVIYLEKWFLRRNHKGLFVDGFHRKDNMPWNSNIIVERLSNYVVKTVSGSVYMLVGKMNQKVESVFPNWLLKKFVYGFPPNWKALYEKFLSDSRNRGSSSDGRAVSAGSKASSAKLSVTRNREKSLKTPDSRPPVSTSSTKTSRSGRLIKPPLEYWKGGRVILDAHMNVTIHECYDTSVCKPDVTTTVSARASQTPAHVFLPCSDGQDSASDKDALVLLRKAKPPIPRRRRAKVSPKLKPSYSPEPPTETLSSPDEWSVKRTRSNQRHLTTENKLCLTDVPQKQSQPKRPSGQRSKQQSHGTTRPSVTVSGRKRTLIASPESPTDDNMSQGQSSDSDFPTRIKKQGKGVQGQKGHKSQPSRRFPSSDTEESDNQVGKTTRETKNTAAVRTQKTNKKSQSATKSQPAMTSPKSSRSSRRDKTDKGNTHIPQEQDEDDEWTEEELMKLKEAVSFYPKHITGYWAKVARIVGSRSAEECHSQHTAHGGSHTPARKPKQTRKKKLEDPKKTDNPAVISARVGTLRRKQQVRQFLEAMPRENVDDVFSSSYMQNKRFEIHSMCPSEENEDFSLDLEPTTPMSSGFPDAKTPQCLHITPGMMGSPNRSNDDKYVYQLQKRMKKSQFNVCKVAPSAKLYAHTISQTSNEEMW